MFFFYVMGLSGHVFILKSLFEKGKTTFDKMQTWYLDGTPPKNYVTSKNSLKIQYKHESGEELCTKEHAARILAFNGCLSVHYGSSYTHRDP